MSVTGLNDQGLYLYNRERQSKIILSILLNGKISENENSFRIILYHMYNCMSNVI